MGFQQGLSGLNAASKFLDAVGNNVSNSQTVGFKASQTQFSDVFANSLSGGGGLQIGIGTKVAAVIQQFSQGNVTATANPMDLAINGKGFFRLDDNGTISYSRNGQFQLDKNGNLINSTGLKVTGYPADATGRILTGTYSPLNISSSSGGGGKPKVSSAIQVGVNLDSRLTPPATSPFNPAVAGSFNASTSMSLYDALGNAQTLSYYFAKSASNTWDVYGVLTNPQGTATTLNAGAKMGTLTFSGGTGALVSSTVAVPILTTAQLGTGANAIASITPDFSNTTQYGSAFGVNLLNQDGYTNGQLTGFNIGTDGVVKARYSNGQAFSLGQVVLADFPNAQGLQPIGNNGWAETAASGQPLIGPPSSSSLGVLQSSAVEDSNVDMTAELVNMITAQRAYQANAQTIKTQDQVLQTLVNLR
jgi:flagellar hook protein FlgE